MIAVREREIMTQRNEERVTQEIIGREKVTKKNRKSDKEKERVTDAHAQRDRKDKQMPKGTEKENIRTDRKRSEEE